MAKKTFFTKHSILDVDRAASYCMGKLRMLIGLTQLQCKFTRFKIQI